jgi:hypothetical protein
MNLALIHGTLRTADRKRRECGVRFALLDHIMCKLVLKHLHSAEREQTTFVKHKCVGCTYTFQEAEICRFGIVHRRCRMHGSSNLNFMDRVCKQDKQDKICASTLLPPQISVSRCFCQTEKQENMM